MESTDITDLANELSSRDERKSFATKKYVLLCFGFGVGSVSSPLFLFLPLLFAWHLITGASFLFIYGFRVGFSQGSNCFHSEFVFTAIFAMGASVFPGCVTIQ